MAQVITPETKNKIPEPIVIHRTVSSRYWMINTPTMAAANALTKKGIKYFIIVALTHK